MKKSSADGSSQWPRNYKNKSSVNLWYLDFYQQLTTGSVSAQECNYAGLIKIRGHLTPFLSKSSDYLSDAWCTYSSLLFINTMPHTLLDDYKKVHSNKYFPPVISDIMQMGKEMQIQIFKRKMLYREFWGEICRRSFLRFCLYLTV